MTTNIPAGLRSADIAQLARRAAQLKKYKPVVAYWCEYQIINRILNKGIHTADEDCMTYTTTLMDKLERVKAANADNDAIMDDMAAQAYIEQFALETFQRGDNAMRANKASQQTADTLQAAATFLDLLSIWKQPLDPDITAKIKYAKFHALRIARAIKAGEDPNASNPVREPTPSTEAPPRLDPDDPDVQRINGVVAPQQPSVEDAPDAMDTSPTTRDAPAAFSPPSPTAFSPAQQTSPPPQANRAFAPSPHPKPDEVSPIDSPPNERAGSIGGGYFPAVPTFTSGDAAPGLPTAPPPPPRDEDMAVPGEGVVDAQEFYATGPPEKMGPFVNTSSSVNTGLPVDHARAPSPLPTSLPDPPAQVGQYRTDDEAVMSAQKHAKWAISALNFEDVPTAVRELRVALRVLGAG